MNSRNNVWIELGLWGSASFFCLMHHKDGSSWWQLISLWVLFFTLFLITKHRAAPTSGLLIVATFAVIGWLFMCRIDASLALAHWQHWIAASIAYLLALHINWSDYNHKYLYGIFTLLILLITVLIGVEIGGAKAWLNLGSLQFQPIEFARVPLLLFLGGYFYDNQLLLRASSRWPLLRYWGPMFLLMAGVFLFLGVQRDLGPALLFFAIFITMSLYTAFSWHSAAIYLSIGILGVMVGWFQFTHFQQRVWVWLNPWMYEHSLGYQILQGLFALNAGGVFGTGLGYGRGLLIPEVHTDYIFALIGEEFGLVGATLVLLLYLTLLFWIVKISAYTSDKGHLLAIGVMLLWGFQVFLVVAGILKLIPLSGMTLPFISYGGSSLMANMWLLGIITSLGVKRNVCV